MKALFLLMVFSLPTLAGDREELDVCVQEIQAQSQALLHRIPSEIFSADRKLFHMTEAIPFLSANRALLGEVPVLVSNALEGCRLFQSRYFDRAWSFQLFLLCIIALVVALTLRVILIMVSTPSLLGVSHGSDSSSRSDIVPRDRNSSGNPEA